MKNIGSGGGFKIRNLKFVQINIYRGRYLGNLIKFLKKENPDIISAQEVTTGLFNFYQDKTANLFLTIKEKLNLNGVYSGDLKLLNHLDSSFGNAVFSRFQIVQSKVVVLKKFRLITLEELDGSKAVQIRPLIPRHILEVTLNIENISIHAISVHGAWTAPPTDTRQNLRQAEIIASYLKSLGQDPYILGGDLNMPPGTKVIEKISAVSTNLMLKSPTAYTTHPKIHKIAPRKLLVDYIFTSKHFLLKSINVPEVIVSDHLPVIANLAFKAFE